VPHSDDATTSTTLQAILDAFPVPVFLLDAAGRITHVNRSFLQVWGPAGDDPSWRPAWGKKPVTGSTPGSPTEVHVDTDGGSRRTLLQYVHPLEGEGGRVAGAVVVHVDVTEQRRREHAERFLADATRILSASFEYVDQLREVAAHAVTGIADWCGIYLLSPDGIQHLGTIGRGAGERKRIDEIEREYFAPPARAVEEACRSGESLLVSRVDGELLAGEAVDDRHLELLEGLGLRSLIVVPLVAHGEVFGAITLLAGPTSRAYDSEDLHAAEMLADRAAIALDNARHYHDARRRAVQEEALRKAAAAVSAASTIQDVIAEVARRALEAIGADGAFVERIDIRANEVELVAAAGIWTPETGLRLPYSGSLAQSVIERGEPILLEPGQHHDSVLLKQMTEVCGPCAILVVPLRDGGEPVGCLILIRAGAGKPFQLDELSRAQAFGELAALAFRKIHLLEEAERRRVDLERVTESRTRLIRGFSHDLKNPLNAADGYLALLSAEFSEGLDEKQLAFVSRVRSLLRVGIGLIEDLGELHQVEAGQIPIRPVAVEMIDLVHELVEAYRPQAELKGLTLSLHHPERVPVIESDGSRIRQILGNLLSNAVKYTRRGGIRVTLHVPEDASGGSPEWVAVQVADTGPGIPRDKQELVFREFTRVAPEGSRGAGLGLAISQRIAEALLGRLTVESEVGKGSVFTLWLPCVRQLDVPFEEGPILVDSWQARGRPPD
jgi:signal transduction histidine kinase